MPEEAGADESAHFVACLLLRRVEKQGSVSSRSVRREGWIDEATRCLHTALVASVGFCQHRRRARQRSCLASTPRRLFPLSSPPFPHRNLLGRPTTPAKVTYRSASVRTVRKEIERERRPRQRECEEREEVVRFEDSEAGRARVRREERRGGAGEGCAGRSGLRKSYRASFKQLARSGKA